MTTRERLDAAVQKRILVLDGAMGTMIQNFALTEADFRGERFAGHPRPLAGCNDILCLTRPGVVASIHQGYLRAGADIIETCSFNANAISLMDYGLEGAAYEINLAAARIAGYSAECYSTADKPRFVAGVVGPTGKTAAISADVDDPGSRAVTWDELEGVYYESARGLLDGGADILMVETAFDTLNAKAALFAIGRLLEERGSGGKPLDLPVMVSGTIVDAAGRTLSGQTVEAFCASILHAEPWSVGLNCSLGAERLRPHLAALSDIAPCPVSAHPNAGLPNRFGHYDESPKAMADFIETFLKEGLVNIVGGCCGSTPAHIAAIAERAARYAPRKIPPKSGRTELAGLELLRVDDVLGFVDVGERTNVAGSRRFLRFIKDEKYREAMAIAREMVEAGASVLDVCMDDALLDAPTTMVRFLNQALSDPEIARLPVMVDSSRWEALEAGLKCLQGKGIVNSISLKEGETEFLRRARLARRYGAAIIVMLFDERGQADTLARKIELADRSYRLLVGAGIPAEDIIFDPNVLAVATGIPEHNRYALDFIEACSWIREHCPGAKISGGISNLSFSFRGNDRVREALHAVFLKHAVPAGLTMAIVNPAGVLSWDELDPTLQEAAEDVVLARREDAADRLLALALTLKDGTASTTESGGGRDAWRSLPVEERILHALVKGLDDHIAADVLELRPRYARALDLIEGPLMRGMNEVGDRFGAGKMFLPQVIRSARVMKVAVAALEPFIQAEKASAGDGDSGERRRGAGKIVMATVKGDVHDIGKNIVSIVLGCNGYEVVDLGVMVPADKILESARREKADLIGLSGLITPSLDEMVHTAREMEERGFRIPLLIGGATTSEAHTALRIAPAYSSPVVHVKDAGRAASVVRSLLSETDRPRFLELTEMRYREAAERHERIRSGMELVPLEEARANRVTVDWLSSAPVPRRRGIQVLPNYPLERLVPYIDWSYFFYSWDLGHGFTRILEDPEKGEAARRVYDDGRRLLDRIVAEKLLDPRGVFGFFPAHSEGEDLVILEDRTGGKELARFSFLRNQERKRAGGPNPCLTDFVAPRGSENGDWIGLFAVTAGHGLDVALEEFRSRNDDYGALLLASLADRLAEAFAEELHLRVRREFWGYAPEEDLSVADLFEGRYRGIRPAVGYPACPDHADKRILFKILDAGRRCGIELTETDMMIPAASVSGFYFSHPAAYYFGVGRVGEDQLSSWAGRKGIEPQAAAGRLGRI